MPRKRSDSLPASHCLPGIGWDDSQGRIGVRFITTVVSVVCVRSYEKDSPPSGLSGFKVYNTFASASASGEHSMTQDSDTGIFPREALARPPGGFFQAHGLWGLLPGRFPPMPPLTMREEGHLNDVPPRENVVDRVLVARLAETDCS
jgi:hypothetical protein